VSKRCKDLVQGEAELPQREHLLQTRDVVCRVQAIPCLGVKRRLQQTDRVVMVQRTDGLPRPLCQFAYLQGLEAHGD
jgi:hypothetical protein